MIPSVHITDAKDVYDQQSRTAFPVPVLPGENQAFWVDVFVKNGSTPGTHGGKVTVRWAGNSPPTALPLSLKVHQFTLPSISRYQTTYNCNPKGIAAGRMGKATPTREQKVKWQKQYVDLGLMHRVTFSDFLKADEVALGAPVPPSLLCGSAAPTGRGEQSTPEWLPFASYLLFIYPSSRSPAAEARRMRRRRGRRGTNTRGRHTGCGRKRRKW